MKKLLALAPSPRRGGNSDLLLQEFCRAAAESGWQVETLRINDLQIKPCQACDACAKDGRCIVKDDMQDVYPRLVESDALVVASPITFGSMNAQLKTFIDRFQCWWHAKYNLKAPLIPDDARHPGYFICVGAIKREQYCNNALEIVKVFFHNINHKLIGSIAFRGYDARGEIAEDKEAMQRVYQAGRDFIAAIEDK